MTFVSIEFLILFLMTTLLISKFKGKKQRQIILLGVSYVFYAYWDIRFLTLLIGQTIVCFFLAREIGETESVKKKKQCCAAGIIVLLSVLGFFKYFNFFLDNVDRLLGLDIPALHIILPIGISFYTFQAMSYLIDVYRRNLEARKDFLDVALYISFFPQLVAGPIMRASDFFPQLDVNHGIEKKNVQEGIQIFLFGLLKKAVIADRLAVCVDAVFEAPIAYDTASIICAVVAYSLQIYCDFSGYSDMAIGVARFFGYELCENFNLPYLSQNPTEFWKRWHISLSLWLQDYLYISMGGNRKGKIRTYVNLMLTMVIGGLWHGANWTFVVWGTLHGGALVVHKWYIKLKKKYSIHDKGPLRRKVLAVLSAICMYAFACICWVFFRAQNMQSALLILRRMFIWSSGIHYIYVYTIIYGILVLGCYIVAVYKSNGEQKINGFYPLLDLEKFSSKVIVCLIIWLILAFSYGGDTAFVYFQF